MSEQLKARIKATGPKTILALDGGGIRGMITIEVLEEMENLLRRELHKGPEFRLAQFFDFVAGTSTGAIIAACISSGMAVSEIREFYERSGKEMFDKVFLLNVSKRFRTKYGDEKLAQQLQRVFEKDATMGSDKLQTVLMMVMRNATTDSPWPVSNNPFAKYNQRDRKDCNLNIPLWQLIRASTAAPTFFPPEVVTFAQGTPKEYQFIFVDGGVTMYNNPAFQAFLMATVEPYKMDWATGEDQLLVVSVGTGSSPKANADLAPGEMNLVYNATSIPSALMYAALNEQDLLCRVFGRCLAGDDLDREICDLKMAKGPGGPSKFFTYVRYNAELTEEGLRSLGLSGIEPEHVQRLDSTDYIDELQQVGKPLRSR